MASGELSCQPLARLLIINRPLHWVDDSTGCGASTWSGRGSMHETGRRRRLRSFVEAGPSTRDFLCRRKARFRASVASDLRRVCVIDFVEITRGETGRIYWWISDRSVPNSIWEESSSYRTRFGSGKWWRKRKENNGRRRANVGPR
jgi:hypothetical protein